MIKIEEAFKNKKAFIPFVLAGYPNLEATENFIIKMAEAGADLIEIGIPFSDPVAEGTVIQAASKVALSGNMTTNDIFNMAEKLKGKVNIPLVFMTYINPIFVYGKDKFFARCKQCNIGGVIVADLPFEEKDEILTQANENDVEVISLIAPTSENRIGMIANEAQGFIYCVSSLGVTGVRKEIKTDIQSIVDTIRKYTDKTDMAEAIDIRELNERIEKQSAFVTNLITGMDQVIVGQKHLVESLLIGLLSDGHVLLEGVPGLAKTLAIKTLASLIDGKFSRVQFTPDLLPADVIGTMMYSQKDETFIAQRGPIFANFVLADEINRAPAKVQSALLEAMQERQVTISKETYKLPEPFLVLATQNPIEQEGTYPLPEAQVDRFMLKVIIDYPKLEEEKKIIRQQIKGEKTVVRPILSTDEIIEARNVVREVYLDEKIEQYIADIVFATRYPEQYGLKDLKNYIEFGGSPRASINLALAARAYAFIKRRGYVIPEDVRAIAHDVLRHRIGLSYEAEANNVSSEEIISQILNKVEVP